MRHRANDGGQESAQLCSTILGDVQKSRFTFNSLMTGLFWGHIPKLYSALRHSLCCGRSENKQQANCLVGQLDDY